MRTLRVFESISIDGFFTGVGDDMSWAHAGSQDAEFADWVSGNAGSGGELLFGRKTYQMMEAFWPTPIAAQQMPLVAKGMNAARKYVASKTITPTWNNTTLLTGDLVEAIRSLKAGDGPDITVLGSGSVAAQLVAADLVDQFQFVILPIALGAGRSVFPKRCELRLVGERVFRNGNVVVTYAAR
ncbi:dihydrofolate reductase family protein [Paraburkholderia agricolaris]|jgi:dihydrofolate reductase|uniref:Dihydrofolate reductase family protein n=1 Tax=Paraburkholderia agricolaris TaxID=2152888 RepID=A0ABW8ZL99_9BURK|nr:dihydrofolate reductase family protein [Paraburkholderia agricolaris]